MIATRVAFGKTLAQYGEEHPNVVVLDADLSKSTKSEYFADKFPQRFFEMGIAEANMVGTAAGLSFCGKRAFLCSFGAFIVGRQDIIRMSLAYSSANVVVVGTHAGIAIGPDGYSQMAQEDIAVMRSLSRMKVFQPSDAIEAAAMTRFLMGDTGPAYLRLTRQDLPAVHDDNYVFEPGKADVLRTGKNLALIATGSMSSTALAVAETLAKQNVDCTVINIHTIKPLDAPAICEAARACGKVVTLEDHNILGGLGGAVCEVLSEGAPVPVKRIGVEDVFAESGDPAALYAKYKLDEAGVLETIQTWLKGLK